jgi:hypothetical protein
MFIEQLVSIISFIVRLILFPIKIVLFIIAHLILLLPKHKIKRLLKYSLKIILFCIGFNTPIIIDKRTRKGNEPPIIVYQHHTLADHYFLLSLFDSIKFVLSDSHVSKPIVKQYIRNFGFISVSDKVKTGVTQKIIDYIESKDYTNKLAISPEGGKIIKNNVDILAPFSSGAFVPLAPVQPILIQFKYGLSNGKDRDNNEICNPSWNSEYFKTTENIISWYLWRFFAEPCDVVITLLEEESAPVGATPKQYAEVVRNKMIHVLSMSIES